MISDRRVLSLRRESGLRVQPPGSEARLLLSNATSENPFRMTEQVQCWSWGTMA
jgi:hypothetical protein